MKPLFLGWRYAAVSSLLLALPVGVACTASADPQGNESEVVDALEIAFPKMYSAYFDGKTFQIPAKVSGVKKVTWSADPADAVEFEQGDDDSETLITVKKSGKITIKAKAGSLKASAPLEVTKATQAEWEEGNQRYNNGVVLVRPQRPDGGWGGGGGREDGGSPERRVDPKLSCTNCHNRGGKDGNDVEHTPTQTGGYSDEELLAILTKAEKPAGVKMRVTTKEKWQKFHKWEMSPEEAKGLVVYLRAIPPESQGEVDFGGILHKRGDKGNKGGSDKGGRGADDDSAK